MHQGNKHVRHPRLEYGAERSAALLEEIWRQWRMSDCAGVDEAFCRAVAAPAPRFWVSEERATAVVSRLLAGRTLGRMRPMRRRMFADIARRVRQLLEAEPSLSLYLAVERVVNSPAPSYYLSPGSAKAVFYARRMRDKG